MNGSNIKQMYEDSIDNNHDKSQQSINRIRELKINDSNLRSNKSISNIESPSILRHKQPIITHDDINIDLIKNNSSIHTIQKSNPTMHSYIDSVKKLPKPQKNDVSSSLTLPQKSFNASVDIQSNNLQPPQNRLSFPQNPLVSFSKEDENNISLGNPSQQNPSQHNKNKFNHINEGLNDLKNTTSNHIKQATTLQQHLYLSINYPNKDKAYIEQKNVIYEKGMQSNPQNHAHVPISIGHQYSSSNEGINKFRNKEETPLYSNNSNSGSNNLLSVNQNYDGIYANQSNQSYINSIYSRRMSENGPNYVIKEEINRMNVLQDYDLQSVLY